jgi:uncharacterized protein YbjT (DUF2867 family)
VRALVIGGTGKVGSAVMTTLAERGTMAVAAARHAPPGGIPLDLRDAGSVAAAARGFDVAFLATPLGPEETKIGLGAVDALRSSGVGHIVYLGIMNLEAMREIPHFETKIPIRDAVLASGGTMLAANFFFQNDAMMLPAIVGAGVYPMPVGNSGIWSVDARDIGRAGAHALLSDRWAGECVPLCGTERLTGPAMAAIWSDALARPVVYGGDAIEPFLAALSRQIPDWNDWMAQDFATMMRVTQSFGCPASDDDIARSTAMIGRPPRRYRDFVAELAAAATHQTEGTMA